MMSSQVNLPTFTPSLLQILSARSREYADCLSALDGSEEENVNVKLHYTGRNFQDITCKKPIMINLNK